MSFGLRELNRPYGMLSMIRFTLPVLCYRVLSLVHRGARL